MRKRPIRLSLYFDEDEHKNLCELSRKTNLTKNTLIRNLLKGYEPCEAPPVDYNYLIRELRAIGNNINQMLVIVRSNGFFNSNELRKHLDKLEEIENKMYDTFDYKKEAKKWR